jgi:hypothetical protein
MDSGILGFIWVLKFWLWILVGNYKYLIKKIGGGHDLKVDAPI